MRRVSTFAAVTALFVVTSPVAWAQSVGHGNGNGNGNVGRDNGNGNVGNNNGNDNVGSGLGNGNAGSNRGNRQSGASPPTALHRTADDATRIVGQRGERDRDDWRVRIPHDTGR